MIQLEGSIYSPLFSIYSYLAIFFTILAHQLAITSLYPDFHKLSFCEVSHKCGEFRGFISVLLSSFSIFGVCSVQCTPAFYMYNVYVLYKARSMSEGGVGGSTPLTFHPKARQGVLVSPFRASWFISWISFITKQNQPTTQSRIKPKMLLLELFKPTTLKIASSC